MYLKQLYYTFFICLFGCPILSAQATLIHPIPKFTLKYSPISLVDVFAPSIQFAVEQRIANRQSLQYEAGYLTSFGGRYINPNSLEGYRLRLEWRRYKQLDVLRSQSSPEKNWMKYTGFQVMWMQHFVDQSKLFCRDNCNYFQQIDYLTSTYNIAGYWHFGWVYRSGNFRLEFGNAVGLRVIDIKDTGIPGDAEAANNGFNNRSVFFRTPGRDLRFPFFSATVVVKVGYVLKK